MASSSSGNPSSQSQKKYDVFVSFRGEDTRFNFTSHLHEALRSKQIDTYIDYRLEKGDEVWPSLEKAIEDSTLFLVIFSENYASSTWCLKELAKILECSKNEGHLVMPVFYRVDHDPSGIEFFPRSLKLLRWVGYPLKTLPTTFWVENIVQIEMPGSRLTKLCDGVQNLVNLSQISLMQSENLIELPNFSKAIFRLWIMKEQRSKNGGHAQHRNLNIKITLNKFSWHHIHILTLLQRKLPLESVYITAYFDDFDEGHLVMPVFYRVDPSHLRKQSGSSQKSFELHEHKGIDKQQLQSWREAHTYAANLSGWPCSFDRNEAELNTEITKCVVQKLDDKYQSEDSLNLIGIDGIIADVESLLYKGSNDDVRFIRTWGMDGVGKTTLAKASFNKFHSAYERPCFLNNVREESKKYGIAALKEKLILELLGDKESQIDMECSNFTSFSYEVLRRSLIETYLDCIFKKADEVWPSLKKAIEDSTRSVVISSKKYASSSWCLMELTEIFECQKNEGHLVIPVFCTVRKRSGSYQKAFEEHKGKSINKQQLQKWRESESINHSAKANIPCWDLGHGWYRQNKLLQKATKGHGCDEGDMGKITLAKALLKQWVVAGADDMFIRVYNYNTMDKVKAVEAQTDYIRLENPLNYGLERVWAIGYMEGSRRVVIGYDEGTTMVSQTNW